MPLTDNSDSLVTRNLTVEDSLELGDDTPVELKEMSGPPTPNAGSLLLYAKSDGKLYAKNDAGTEMDLSAAGETNTASNVGVGGVGIFKQKSGVDLQLKNLAAGSAKIVLTDDVANSEVDIDLGSVAVTDLSDVAGKTGSSTTVVMQDSPSLTTPTIGDFSNATHSHQNAAGGGTLSAAAIASGTLDSNRLADKHKTITKIVYIEDPTASDSFPIAYVADASTMVAVRAVTDTGSVDFNLEKRAKLTPDQAGTDVWSSGGLGELQAVAAGVERTTFDNGGITADNWLNYNASAVAGSPTKLWIAIEYKID